MGEKEREALKLQFDRRLRLEFHGARITSDAGLLACRELDGALRLTEVAPVYLQETRGGRNVQHELVPVLRQSVYSRLAATLTCCMKPLVSWVLASAASALSLAFWDTLAPFSR